MDQRHSDDPRKGVPLNVKQQTVEVAGSATTQPSEDLLDPVHPEFSSKSARVSSFKGWPVNKQQKPEDLAEAGLFYIAKDDKTVCYYCGGGLKDWEEGDDPWQQHELWFQNCDYVRHKNKS